MRTSLRGRSSASSLAGPPGRPSPARRRRGALGVVAAVTALALTLAACGDDDDEPTPSTSGPSPTAAGDSGGYAMTKIDAVPASPTLDRIVERGRIIVGTKADQPLFGLVNPTNGEYEGFDTEIARLLALRIFGDVGAIEFVETISRNREPYIQQGRVDAVVATYTINDARKELVSFAGPYYIAGQDIMVKADDDSITSVDDLNGKRVCSVQGSTSEQNLVREAPEAEPLLLDNYSSCAEALADGRVDAVTTDNVILLGLVDANDGEFKLVGNPFTSEPYGIGLPREDTVFREFVNDTLELAYENGDWAKAFEETVGVVEPNTPTPPPVDRYALS